MSTYYDADTLLISPTHQKNDIHRSKYIREIPRIVTEIQYRKDVSELLYLGGEAKSN